MHRDHLPLDPKFVYIFCLLDRRKMELTRIWVVPAAIFYKHAYRTVLSKGMVQYNFDCRVAGDDRWDKYEVTRQGLGPRLVELIRAAHSRRRARVVLREQVAGGWLQMVG